MNPSRPLLPGCYDRGGMWVKLELYDSLSIRGAMLSKGTIWSLA
jgi:hypothetical protein